MAVCEKVESLMHERYGTNETDIEPHTCPYAEEINRDYESLCECCEGCEHQCAMDI